MHSMISFFLDQRSSSSFVISLMTNFLTWVTQEKSESLLSFVFRFLVTESLLHSTLKQTQTGDNSLPHRSPYY